MKRIIISMGALIVLACTAQATVNIFGTPKDMEAVRKYKATKKGLEQCMNASVKPLQTQLDKLPAQIEAAEKAQKKLFETAPLNGQVDVSQVEKKQAALDKLQARKKDLERQITEKTNYCKNKFPAKWTGVVYPPAMELQYNLNQSMSKLLQRGQLEAVSKLYDSIPVCRDWVDQKKDLYPKHACKKGNDSAWVKTTGSHKLVWEGWGHDTYEGETVVISPAIALYYSLTILYKQLYGEDPKNATPAHAQAFFKRFKGHDGLEGKVYNWLTLEVHDNFLLEGRGAFVTCNATYKDMGRLMISYMAVKKKLKLPHRLFQEKSDVAEIRTLLGIIGITTRDETETSYGHLVDAEDLEKFLGGAYGQSVKLGNKALFYEAKRTLLGYTLDFLKQNAGSLDHGGLELLAMHPVTDQEKAWVKAKLSACGGNLRKKLIKYGYLDDPKKIAKKKIEDQLKKHRHQYLGRNVR